MMHHEDLKDLEDKIERGSSLRSWRFFADKLFKENLKSPLSRRTNSKQR